MSALEPHSAFATRFAPLLRVGDEDAVAFQTRRYTGFGAGTAGPEAARVSRGDELSGHQGPDVPAAVEHLEGVLRSESRS